MKKNRPQITQIYTDFKRLLATEDTENTEKKTGKKEGKTGADKMREMPQICAIIFSLWFERRRDGLKRIKRALREPLLETPNYRAFIKMTFKTLKPGLKGV